MSNISRVSWLPNFIVELVIYILNRFAFSRTAYLLASCFVFFIYWVIPGIISFWEGTFFHPNDIRTFLTVSNIEANSLVGELLQSLFLKDGDFPAIQNTDLLYYSRDLTHFLFSVVLSVLAFIGLTILEKIEKFPENFEKAGASIQSEEQIREMMLSYRSYFRPIKWWKISITSLFLWLMAITAAVTAFWFFLSITNTACIDKQCWWGQVGSKIAGQYYSIVIGLIVYFSVEAVFAMLFGAGMLNALMRSGQIKANLTSVDFANGMSPVGDFVLLSFFASLLGGFGIFIILGLGYFGVEKLVPIWLALVSATAFIPMATLVPFNASVALIDQKRRSVVAEISNCFKFEENEHSAQLFDRVIHLNASTQLYRSISELNPFPFDKNKALLSLVTILFVIAQSVWNAWSTLSNFAL